MASRRQGSRTHLGSRRTRVEPYPPDRIGRAPRPAWSSRHALLRGHNRSSIAPPLSRQVRQIAMSGSPGFADVENENCCRTQEHANHHAHQHRTSTIGNHIGRCFSWPRHNSRRKVQERPNQAAGASLRHCPPASILVVAPTSGVNPCPPASEQREREQHQGRTNQNPNRRPHAWHAWHICGDRRVEMIQIDIASGHKDRKRQQHDEQTVHDRGHALRTSLHLGCASLSLSGT